MVILVFCLFFVVVLMRFLKLKSLLLVDLKCWDKMSISYCVRLSLVRAFRHFAISVKPSASRIVQFLFRLFFFLSVRACGCTSLSVLVELLLDSVLEKLQSSSKMHNLILFVREIQMLEA